MKSSDKLKIIDEKIDKINKYVLKNKTWKLKYDNKGKNTYCICIVDGDKEIDYFVFGTFDNVLSAICMVESMFLLALNGKDVKVNE